MHQEALQKAIDHCGGQAALATKLGRKQQNIWFWLHEAKKIPTEIALGIERVTDGAVTARELRPDVFKAEA
jgi:DNA-binding transcriptional regulator YdaS (Cro superfamily)